MSRKPSKSFSTEEKLPQTKSNTLRRSTRVRKQTQRFSPYDFRKDEVIHFKKQICDMTLEERQKAYESEMDDFAQNTENYRDYTLINMITLGRKYDLY